MSGLRFFLRFASLILALVALIGFAAPSQAETGTVRMHITKAGFIVGVGGGSGSLVFKGRTYPFSIGGASFGATIGASAMDVVGRARNLRVASDIAGTYSAIGAGAAVAGGAGVATLQNEKGVVLELQGRKVGLELSVAISGLSISMR